MTENNISEDMPGDNFNRSEKEIADAARKLINRYERLLDKHDKTIEQIYYYRWWTFRKHIKQTPAGRIVTEFIEPVRHAVRGDAMRTG